MLLIIDKTVRGKYIMLGPTAWESLTALCPKSNLQQSLKSVPSRHIHTLQACGPFPTTVATIQCHPLQPPQVLVATHQLLVPTQLLAPQTRGPSNPALTPGTALTAP